MIGLKFLVRFGHQHFGCQSVRIYPFYHQRFLLGQFAGLGCFGRTLIFQLNLQFVDCSLQRLNRVNQIHDLLVFLLNKQLLR